MRRRVYECFRDVGLIESLRNTRENGGIVNVSGMTGGASALAAARLAEENGGQILLIVSTSEKAKQIEEFLAFLQRTEGCMFCRTKNAADFSTKRRAAYSVMSG